MVLNFRPSLFAILLILVAYSSLEVYAALGGGEGCALTGGWKPIENVNDGELVMIAIFALSKHNKMENANLRFDKVIKGETQVVAGTNYRLLISAKKDRRATPSKYEAVVWDKPWEKFRELTSFKKVYL